MAYLATRWLHEAPEEEEQQAQAPVDDAEAPDEWEGNPEEAGEGEEPDENFDINTSLDAEEDDEDGGEDEAPPEDDLEGGGEPAPSGEGEGEANPANTNIFTSLTAAEQEIKIKEMKKLYRELYSAVNDLLHRVDDMDLDEDIMEVMNKVSEILHNLQDSIADYFENIFDIRSYFENDVKYNEFLLVLKRTTTVVDDLANTREKRLGINSTNFKDKNDNI